MASGHNVGVFADVQRVAHVVVGDQYAYAFVAQVTNDLLYVANRDGILPRRRVRPAK